MDDDFEYFLEKMGHATNKRVVPPSSIEHFQGKLPDQLLTYWQEYGWCGYADGLFWTVNPQEYEPVLEAWIGDTPFMEQDIYHIIARSAFGDIYFFGEKSGNNLQIVAPDARAISQRMEVSDMNLEVRAFFGSRSRNGCNFCDVNGERLFTPALKKLGRLNSDEMYGFVPALALGGTAKLECLQKVKAIEHLILLAQLAPLHVMQASEIAT